MLLLGMSMLVDGMATGYAGRVPASRSYFWHRICVDDQFHGLHSKGARPTKTIGGFSHSSTEITANEFAGVPGLEDLCFRIHPYNFMGAGSEQSAVVWVKLPEGGPDGQPWRVLWRSCVTVDLERVASVS